MQAAAYRQPRRAAERVTGHENPAIVVHQRSAQNFRPRAGHRTDHGCTTNIRRNQRARGICVLGIRQQRPGDPGAERVLDVFQQQRRAAAGSTDPGRRRPAVSPAECVRRNASHGRPVQRLSGRHDHRQVRSVAAVARLVDRVQRQPRGRRLRAVPRTPKATGSSGPDRCHVLRERRHYADRVHQRVRVLSHPLPGPGQQHLAAGHYRRVAGVAQDLPAHLRPVWGVRQLHAVFHRRGIRRGVRVPVHSGNQGQNVRRDRGVVQAKPKSV